MLLRTVGVNPLTGQAQCNATSIIDATDPAASKDLHLPGEKGLDEGGPAQMVASVPTRTSAKSAHEA